MKLPINLAISLASMLLVAVPARADVVPPDVAPCSSKQLGNACTYNSAAGLCQDGTCGRLDYANWDRDASTSPPSITYPCLKCVTGSATTTITGTTTTTSTVTATTSPTATDTNTATATPTSTASNTDTATNLPTDTGTSTTTGTTTTSPTDTGSNTATDTGHDDPPADDDGACSIGKGITAKRVAPWLLAASFSLLFLFGRRRRS